MPREFCAINIIGTFPQNGIKLARIYSLDEIVRIYGLLQQ